MSNPFTIAIIYGSVREGRQGIRAARFLEAQCKSRGWQVTLLDPLELKLPLLAKRYRDFSPGTAPEPLDQLSRILADADAYIVVSAEYNHALPPALTNLLDYFKGEFSRKPCACVTYSAGSFGGVRVTAQLRSLLGELGMVSLPAMMPIPSVQDQFDENGSPHDADAWDRRAKTLLDELAWYAEALKAQRAKNDPADA